MGSRASPRQTQPGTSQGMGVVLPESNSAEYKGPTTGSKGQLLKSQLDEVRGIVCFFFVVFWFWFGFAGLFLCSKRCSTWMNLEEIGRCCVDSSLIQIILALKLNFRCCLFLLGVFVFALNKKALEGVAFVCFNHIITSMFSWMTLEIGKSWA